VTESLVMLCYLLLALVLGLGIGGTLWLAATALTTARALREAVEALYKANMDMQDLLRVSKDSIKVFLTEIQSANTTALKALVDETQLAHETLGVVTEQSTRLWSKVNAQVKEPRIFHPKEFVNGAGQQEEQPPEEVLKYEQDWRNG